MINTKQFLGIGEDWQLPLKKHLNSSSFLTLSSFLKEERKNRLIFPSEEEVFSAFKLTAYDQVKVVIIGQDPYHSYDEHNKKILPHAHGLSFSVPKSAKKIPPSLQNIFKEIHQDLGLKTPKHGHLNGWAEQGVLLLNATLTVRAHEAGSHQKKGWEPFTDSVIELLSKEKYGLVFLLWGKFAQQKAALIDHEKHSILTAAHPSPFSAYKGFFGCKHFSKTNLLLKEQKQNEIDWEIK